MSSVPFFSQRLLPMKHVCPKEDLVRFQHKHAWTISRDQEIFCMTLSNSNVGAVFKVEQEEAKMVEVNSRV